MATIKDISEKVNLSPATISRVLNFDMTLKISDEKRKLILETAEMLKYETPRAKNKLNSLIDVAIVYWYNIKEDLEDPYYIGIKKGIEVESLNKNIKLINFYKNENNEYIIDEKLDNAILIGKYSEEQINYFKEKFKNIVCVDFNADKYELDSVLVDFQQLVENAINYLIKLQYKNIAYIGGLEKIGDEYYKDDRNETVEDYLKKKELYKRENVKFGQFTHESGYKLTKELLENKVDCILCASDAISMGAYKAIQENGLNIPNDIGIISIDDLAFANFMVPSLTTFNIPTNFMGECAVNLIIENIEGKEYYKKVLVPTKLIKRNSLKTT